MKIDRMSLAPFVRRSAVSSVSILLVDLTIYAAMIYGTATAESAGLRLLFSLGAGVMIGLLAIVGHDAGHQTFGISKTLNRVCGTVAFLPALHPLSLWEHHHNRVHHRFTAQIGLDNAFSPMTVEEFRAAPRWLQLRYRFLRSAWGQPFSYLMDVWAVDIFTPFLKDSTTLTRRNWFDLIVVYLYVPVFLTAATALSLPAANGDLAWAFLNAFLFSFFIPFMIWNGLIAFMAIVQHTSPETKWVMPTGQPSTVTQALAGTVHIVLPEFIDWMFHRVMHHQAHHVNVGVPFQHLVEAQKSVAAANDGRLVAAWSVSYHMELTRRCKLYDPHTASWKTFEDALAPARTLERAA